MCRPVYKQPPLNRPCQLLSFSTRLPGGSGACPHPGCNCIGGRNPESRRRPHLRWFLSLSPPLLTQSPKPGFLLTSGPQFTPEGSSEHPVSQPRPCSGSPLPSQPHSLVPQGPSGLVPTLLCNLLFLILPRVAFWACPSPNAPETSSTTGFCCCNSKSLPPGELPLRPSRASADTQFSEACPHLPPPLPPPSPRIHSALSHLLPGAQPRRSGSS